MILRALTGYDEDTKLKPGQEVDLDAFLLDNPDAAETKPQTPNIPFDDVAT